MVIVILGRASPLILIQKDRTLQQWESATLGWDGCSTLRTWCQFSLWRLKEGKHAAEKVVKDMDVSFRV